MVIKNGKVVIHAVHERDAEGYWKHLKLSKVEKCFICGTNVTWESFGAVSQWEGKVIVVCESLSCFYELSCKKRDERLRQELEQRD